MTGRDELLIPHALSRPLITAAEDILVGTPGAAAIRMHPKKRPDDLHAPSIHDAEGRLLPFSLPDADAARLRRHVRALGLGDEGWCRLRIEPGFLFVEASQDRFGWTPQAPGGIHTGRLDQIFGLDVEVARLGAALPSGGEISVAVDGAVVPQMSAQERLDLGLARGFVPTSMAERLDAILDGELFPRDIAIRRFDGATALVLRVFDILALVARKKNLLEAHPPLQNQILLVVTDPLPPGDRP